jgi:PII-like signaling protein
MTPVQRLEIIIDQRHAEEIGAILRREGVKGYTIFPGLSGWGDRGEQWADDISGVSTNVCLMTACDPATARKVGEKILPVLRQLGGLCLVSEASILREQL